MTSSPWTNARVRRLAELWNDGRSAAWIARDLGAGVSRCSVLGKVYRLRLTRPPSTPTVASSPPSRAAVPAARGAPPACLSAREGRIRQRDDLPAMPTATILTVRTGECRWPYGQPDQPGFGLCGRPVGRGAFCLAHGSVGYQRRPVEAESLLAGGVPD